MQTFSETDLVAALKDCFIPGQRRDIVSAGLLLFSGLEQDLEAPGSGIRGVPPRFVAHVRLTAPGPDEALNAQLRAIVENRLLGLPAISRARVTVVPPLFSILS